MNNHQNAIFHHLDNFIKHSHSFTMTNIVSVSYISLRESGILQDAMENESPFVAEVPDSYKETFA
jgi:hypothetical protein